MEELEKIIEKVKQGDDQSFKQLYDLTYKKAYIIALSFMKDETRAKDALQLAYVKLANKIDMVNNAETFQGWFNTIVANTCKDELDKRQEFSFSDYEDYNDQSIDIEDDSRDYKPDENIKYEDDREVVVGFINELPVNQRTALVMQIYEEMKISEIADILGTNENTIKSRLSYAKKTLKAKIEDYKKAGNTLFALPLIPYLRGIFKSYEETIVVDEKLYANISSEVSNILAPKTIVEETTKQVVKTTGKKAGGSILTKVVAAALAIGVAFGGYTYFSNSKGSLSSNATIETIYKDMDGKETLAQALDYFETNVTSYYWVTEEVNYEDYNYRKIYKGDDGYTYGIDLYQYQTIYGDWVYTTNLRKTKIGDSYWNIFTGGDDGVEETSFDYDYTSFYSLMYKNYLPYVLSETTLDEFNEDEKVEVVREDTNDEIILTYTTYWNAMDGSSTPYYTFEVKINNDGYIYYVDAYNIDSDIRYILTYSNFNDESNVFDYDEKLALYQSYVGTDDDAFQEMLKDEWSIER